MEVWDHGPRNHVGPLWHQWYDWASRSRIEPITDAASKIKRHLDGIILAATAGITNASAEGLNSVIQMLEHVARGYRKRERFRNAIYFRLGGLDLYPRERAHGGST